MSRNLRCCLVGAGSMGQNHLRVIQENPDVDLCVIVDPGLAPEKTSGLVGTTAVVPTVEDALELDPSLDCAVLASPTSLHESIATKLAEARIPTLIEKPLAPSVLACERIVEAFLETRTFAAVGHIERFNPAILELKKRIDSSDFGRLLQLSTRRLSAFPRRISDVGVVLDLASHDIDLALFLTGDDYSELSAFLSKKPSGPRENLMVASGRMSNGALVNHVVNWISAFKERSVVATMEAGTYVVDLLAGDLTEWTNSQFPIDWVSLATFKGTTSSERTTVGFPKFEPLARELKSFFDGVRGLKADPIASLVEGLSVVKILEGLLRAAR